MGEEARGTGLRLAMSGALSSSAPPPGWAGAAHTAEEELGQGHLRGIKDRARTRPGILWRSRRRPYLPQGTVWGGKPTFGWDPTDISLWREQGVYMLMGVFLCISLLKVPFPLHRTYSRSVHLTPTFINQCHRNNSN